jgi:hypothetical protein
MGIRRLIAVDRLGRVFQISSPLPLVLLGCYCLGPCLNVATRFWIEVLEELSHLKFKFKKNAIVFRLAFMCVCVCVCVVLM